MTAREAVARGEVTHAAGDAGARSPPARVPKGDVLAVARLAGIMAAKRTADLIPLCHPLPLSHVDVELTPDAGGARVRIESRVRVEARTGVEMEALTAVAVAGLTLYDMCKAVDREHDDRRRSACSRSAAAAAASTVRARRAVSRCDAIVV